MYYYFIVHCIVHELVDVLLTDSLLYCTSTMQYTVNVSLTDGLLHFSTRKCITVSWVAALS